MDSTAKPLFYLCCRRAILLRRALEALEASVPSAHWCTWAMDAVDRELDALKKAIKELEGQKDGRDSE